MQRAWCCPVGKLVFVQAYVNGVVDKFLSTIATLMELGHPARKQEKLLKLKKNNLRKSLQALPQVVNRELLLKILKRVEIAVRDSLLSLINRPLIGHWYLSERYQ